MNGFVLSALAAGFCVTIAGLALQIAGNVAFSRYSQDDSKELAGVVGFRVSAIFGIAVGLIFAASGAYLIEAKRDLQEEARLIATLQFLAAEAPTLENRGDIQQDLSEFTERSAEELEGPTGLTTAGRATSHLLLEICRNMALEEGDIGSVRWTKTEFQRSCSKLIDLRGKKRIGARDALVALPFWIFFAISFACLAFLLGVFQLRPLNIVFACLFYFITGVTGIVIYAANDPYHEPGRISSEPLLQLLPKKPSASSSS
jgi:hypothetical protein